MILAPMFRKCEIVQLFHFEKQEKFLGFHEIFLETAKFVHVLPQKADFVVIALLLMNFSYPI